VIEVELIQIVRVGVVLRENGQVRLVAEGFAVRVSGDLTRWLRRHDSPASQPAMEAEGERLHRERDRLAARTRELDDAG
jgi:hypothetical protein